MAFVLYFSMINSILASTLGLGANFVLLFFMFSTKKAELKPVTKILAQNCIIDILFAFVVLVGQPVSLPQSFRPGPGFEGLYFLTVFDFSKTGPDSRGPDQIGFKLSYAFV